MPGVTSKDLLRDVQDNAIYSAFTSSYHFAESNNTRHCFQVGFVEEAFILLWYVVVVHVRHLSVILCHIVCLVALTLKIIRKSDVTTCRLQLNESRDVRFVCPAVGRDQIIAVVGVRVSRDLCILWMFILYVHLLVIKARTFH